MALMRSALLLGFVAALAAAAPEAPLRQLFGEMLESNPSTLLGRKDAQLPGLAGGPGLSPMDPSPMGAPASQDPNAMPAPAPGGPMPNTPSDPNTPQNPAGQHPPPPGGLDPISQPPSDGGAPTMPEPAKPAGDAGPDRDQTFIVQLKTNDWNTAYSGVIGVGKPVQPFTVTFTTLNDKTWVPGKDGYVESTSTSGVRSDTPFNVGYIVGDAKGFYMEEKITLFGPENVTLEIPGKNLVGISNEISGAADGLLGMGLPPEMDEPGSHRHEDYGNWKNGYWRVRSKIAIDTPDVVSVIRHIIESGVLARPIVSVFLKKCVGGCLDAGFVGFGTELSKNCGKVISWIPSEQNDEAHWKFEVESASIQLKGRDATRAPKEPTVYSTKEKAVTSIGTSIIIMPKDAAQAFAKAIGAYPNGNSYFVPCSKDFEMKLKINGVEYTIPGEQLKMGKGSICQFLVQDAQEGGNFPKWVLGQPVARSYCEVHDYENRQWGLAELEEPKSAKLLV